MGGLPSASAEPYRQGVPPARQRRQARQGALRDHVAVRQQLPAPRQVGEVGEVAPVLDDHAPGVHVGVHAHRLVRLLRLPGVGVRLAVRRHEPVDQEVAVGALARRSEVAAVGPVATPALVGCEERLVHPVPDEAALKRRVCVDHRPVVHQPADAVAHCVGVLHEQEGLRGRSSVRPRGRVALQPVRTHVHRRHDVHVVAFARRLVEDRPPRVALAYPRRRGIEVRSVAGLVAQRPHDHGRVVLVALHHTPRAVQVGGPPLVLACQRDGGIEPHAVGLDVRLVHHVQAVLVGQLVPPRDVGVVGRPHRVDVHLLHQLHVPKHRRLGDDVGALRVVLVTVDAADRHRPPVHLQQPVLHFHAPKADAGRRELDGAAVWTGQPQRQPVEGGRLGGPLTGPVDRCRVGRRRFAAQRDVDREDAGLWPHGVARRVQQLVGDDVGSGRAQPSVRHRDIQGEAAVDEVVLQLATHEKVADVGGGHGDQVHVPVDAADPPEVLTLQVAAVAPSVDLHRHIVCARPHGVGDSELGRRAASLAVAGQVAVDPDVEGGVDAVEVQEHLPPFPSGRQLEGAAVRPHGVVVVGDARRVRGERIGLVPVDGVTVAFELPVAGHLDLVPRGHVELRLEEVHRTRAGTRSPVKLPRAVQAQAEPGVLRSGRQGALARLKGREGRAWRLLPHGKDGGVLPVRQRFGVRRGRASELRG